MLKIFSMDLDYHEFYVSGEGAEVNADSSRDRPRYILSAPLNINKFNVKTLELPLSFNPNVGLTDMPITTTYTDNDNKVAVFNDYIAFTQNTMLTGDTLAAKLAAIFVFHASLTMGAHTVGNVGSISTLGVSTSRITSGFTIPGAYRLQSAVPPTCTVVSSGDNAGTLLMTFTKAAAVTSGASTALASVVVDFGIGTSILPTLMDFPYLQTAKTFVVNTSSGGGTTIINDTSTSVTLRTRPSYFYLHSNLRQGTPYHSTARARETLGTVIAKILIPMEDVTPLGTGVVIWVNASQEPALMYRNDGATYSTLEFWLTYPDGTTQVTFIGNSFSLTLATFLEKSRRY